MITAFKKMHWSMWIHISLFMLLTLLFPNSIHGTDAQPNSIYNQLFWIVGYFDQLQDDFYVTYYHFFRLLTVYPLYLVAFKEPSSLYHYILLLPFIPLLSHMHRRGDNLFLGAFLCYSIFVFSLRVIYPALGIAYLYVLLESVKSTPFRSHAKIKGNLMYFAGFCFSAISSGSMLVWFFINLCFVRSFIRAYPIFFIITAILFSGFIYGSFVHKYKYYGVNEIMAATESPEEKNTKSLAEEPAHTKPTHAAVVKKLTEIFYTGTLVSDMIHGRTLATTFNFFTLLLNVYCLIHALRNGKNPIIFLSILPLYLLHGPGFTSGLFVGLMYMLHYDKRVQWIESRCFQWASEKTITT